MLGTPSKKSKKDIHEMNINNTDYKFPINKCFTWRQVLGAFNNIDDQFLDLISKLLEYSPSRIISAFEA